MHDRTWHCSCFGFLSKEQENFRPSDIVLVRWPFKAVILACYSCYFKVGSVIFHISYCTNRRDFEIKLLLLLTIILMWFSVLEVFLFLLGLGVHCTFLSCV